MTTLEKVHRRRNALTGEWVLVSPHRMNRPWQGKVEDIPTDDRPAYDPGCYLCPGNVRASGEKNPDYTHTYAFDNDFAALRMDAAADVADSISNQELFQARVEQGLCRVLCFSPYHNLTLAGMEVPAIRRVVDLWTQEFEQIGALPDINYVQIFENKGELMGCSNPHPHGQIWAQKTIPNEPAKESVQFGAYWNAHGRSLLEDYLILELRSEIRLVYVNDHFAVIVPFWAVWPFETMIVSMRPVGTFARAFQ